MLLPGIMAISMVMTGVQAVAMPLIAEFQFTREIEDRLLAPIRIEWLAVEKIVAGMLQALVAGAGGRAAGVADAGLRSRDSATDQLGMFAVIALLVALFSSAGGLTLGCSVGQTQIGLMFSLVLAPMIMFGCAYYPWSALKASRYCKSGADQSAGVCERRTARHARAAVSAHADAAGGGRARRDRCDADFHRAQPLSK